MHTGQNQQGRNNFFLVVVFILFASTLAFVLFTSNVKAGVSGNAPVSVSCPACQCPSCSASAISANPDSTAPYVPRPFTKSAHDRMFEKLKRHQLKIHNFWPWYFFESTYECKMGEDRVGLAGEGGKWMCGMSNLLQKPKCIVYSMGSNGQHDFEDEMMTYTSCEIHTFDMDDFSHVFNGTRVQFHKSKIGDGTDGTQTISYWMKKLGHTYIDVLKIDIEMGEYPAFDHLLKQNPLPWIGQVLIEFHLLKSKFPSLSREEKYKHMDKILNLVENLHNLGLVQFHREENPVGDACEFSYGNLKHRPPV